MFFLKIKRFFSLSTIVVLILVNSLYSADVYNADKYYNEGSLLFKFSYELLSITNRLLEDWRPTANYKYQKTANSGTSNWKSHIDQTIKIEPYLNLGKLKAMMEVEGYADGYNSFWQPNNDINKLDKEKEHFRVKKAEVNLKDYFYHMRYFRGTPRAGWDLEGDLFDYLPDQYETDRYLNTSQRAVPEGVELDYTDVYLGSLNVIYGEPVWGKKDSFYGKYKYEDFYYLDFYFLYKYEEIPWNVTYGDKYQQAYQFTTNIKNLFPFELFLGATYNPFRKDWEYDTVEKRNGLYYKNTEKTREEDAYGYAMRVNYKNEKMLFNLRLDAQYLNILAGNRKSAKIDLTKSMHSGLMINFDAEYREPVIPAMPLVYNNSNQNNASGAYISPRGETSPFRVDRYNREATIMNLGLSWFSGVFNPHYLFKYEMGNLEDWNLNYEDNVPFAVSVNYKYEKYPTSTDAQYYYDANGNILWDSPTATGLLAIKDPLNTYQMLIKGRLADSFTYFLIGQVGDSMATGSSAYSNTNNETKALITFTDLKARLGYNKYFLSMGYKENFWGPEEWQRFFGLTYDNLYTLEFGKDFGKWGIFSISGMKAEQKNITAESELPSFEEIGVKWVYDFTRIYNLGHGSEIKKLEEIQKLDKYSPTILVVKNINYFTPNDDGLNDYIEFTIDAKDDMGINKWLISITDDEDNLIFRREGLGEAPTYFEWRAYSYELLAPIKNGIYNFQIKVIDLANNSTDSEILKFKISNHKTLFAKDGLKKLTQTSKVEIIEDSGVLSFKYDIANIYNLEDSKSRMEIIAILKDMILDERVQKIKIITYFNNQQVANRIASDIADEFVKYGINKEKFEILGIVDKQQKDNVNILCYYQD